MEIRLKLLNQNHRDWLEHMWVMLQYQRLRLEVETSANKNWLLDSSISLISTKILLQFLQL